MKFLLQANKCTQDPAFHHQKDSYSSYKLPFLTKNIIEIHGRSLKNLLIVFMFLCFEKGYMMDQSRVLRKDRNLK